MLRQVSIETTAIVLYVRTFQYITNKDNIRRHYYVTTTVLVDIDEIIRYNKNCYEKILPAEYSLN